MWLPPPKTVRGSAAPACCRNRGDHIPICGVLTRANGVEQPEQNSFEIPLVVIGVGQDLLYRLTDAVGPPSDESRTEQPVGVFGQGYVVVLAVNLTGAGQHKLSSIAMSGFDHHRGAPEVVGERSHRVLKDLKDTCGGSEMYDDVVLMGQLVHQQVIEHGAVDEPQIRVSMTAPIPERSPVVRLSSAMTESPRATSASAKCDPIEPAPPATKYIPAMRGKGYSTLLLDAPAGEALHPRSSSASGRRCPYSVPGRWSRPSRAPD